MGLRTKVAHALNPIPDSAELAELGARRKDLSSEERPEVKWRGAWELWEHSQHSQHMGEQATRLEHGDFHQCAASLVGTMGGGVNRRQG